MILLYCGNESEASISKTKAIIVCTSHLFLHSPRNHFQKDPRPHYYRTLTSPFSRQLFSNWQLTAQFSSSLPRIAQLLL